MSEAQTTHAERWDHDKAEAMAYVLTTRTDFPNLLESQQNELAELETKRHRIFLKSTQRSVDLEEDEARNEKTLPLRLHAIATRATLEDAEVEIEQIELRDKQIANATLASNELLEEYSRFYDTDPERFAAMDGEAFGEHLQKIDDINTFIVVADEGLLKSKDVVHRSDLYEDWIQKGEKPFIDWATIEVGCDRFRYSLQNMFGEDSEEVRRLNEEYKALNDAIYDTYTPKALVVAFCELNRKWHQFIADSKAAKEAELEMLLSNQESTEPIE